MLMDLKLLDSWAFCQETAIVGVAGSQPLNHSNKSHVQYISSHSLGIPDLYKQKKKRVSHSWQLDLQMLMNYAMWMLGSKVRSSERVICF